MKPKLSLEDTMNQLKAENAELKVKNKQRRDRIKQLEMKYENTGTLMGQMTLKARLEESEYKHSIVCEALENLLDDIDVAALPQGAFYMTRKVARKALNGISDEN